jgi:hypothetical protein
MGGVPPDRLAISGHLPGFSACGKVKKSVEIAVSLLFSTAKKLDGSAKKSGENLARHTTRTHAPAMTGCKSLILKDLQAML